MASSLSYGLVGLSIFLGYMMKKRNNLELKINKNLAIPYTIIIAFYPFTLFPVIFPTVKSILGIIFILFFIIYIIIMYREKEEVITKTKTKLYFNRYIRSQVLSLLLQIAISAFLLYYGSSKLVESVDMLAEEIKISPLGVALVIIPVATALPETLTALVWSFKGEDSLSIGSLVGEKVLYSTFYPGLGLLLTSWILDIHAYLSVFATTLVSLVFLYYILKERFPLYILFLGFFFFTFYLVLTFSWHV